MAKSLLSITMRMIKAAERHRVRQANANNRAYNAELKEQARTTKARERQIKHAAIANEKERSAQEKALKAAHLASQLAEVDSLNAQIADVFEELEGAS